MIRLTSRILVILISAISIPPIVAAEFEDKIPLELAQILMQEPKGGELELYSDIVEGFPEFDLPSGFELLGSVDQVSVMRVILKTQLSGRTAKSAMVSAFERADFRFIPSSADTPQFGFILQRRAPLAVGLCHEKFGEVVIRFFEDDNTIFAIPAVLRFPAEDRPSCLERISKQVNSINMVNSSLGFRRHLPQLLLPFEVLPHYPQQGPTISWSKSENFSENTAHIAIDWSVSKFYKYLVDQISSQGWRPQSESMNSNAIVSEWKKDLEGNLQLIGTLGVSKKDGLKYEANFTMSRRSK